jgi:hypothetical protein
MTGLAVPALYIYTGVGELSMHYSDEALYLASDALVLGVEPPELVARGSLTRASNSNARALSAYVEQIKTRHLVAILDLLHPEYKAQRRVRDVIGKLEGPLEGERAAQDVLWAGGLELNRLYLAGDRFARKAAVWFKRERLRQELVTDLDEALGDSLDRLNTLGEEGGLTLENVLAACQSNRRAMLLLFLARLGYGSEEKIERFLKLTTSTHVYTKRVAARTEDPTVKSMVRISLESEQRRMNILSAMLDNDMERVREILKKTIQKALAEKEAAKSGG